MAPITNGPGQTRFGVRIPAGSALDTDAAAFISVAGLTSSTHKSAINVLVTDLKAYGIWTKMKAIYPFVGGSATAHKFNLKDPRDLDAAFRLVFSGGWTHTATGALPNGTNGYYSTSLNPSSTLSTNSVSLTTYLRTDYNDPNGVVVDFGTPYYGGNVGIHIYSRSTNIMYVRANSYPVGISNNNSLGLHGVTRLDGTNLSFIRNNNFTTTAAQSFSNANSIIYGSYGGYGYYSAREQAFASIGDGLTDTEAANFYTAVQKFQTSLGRQFGVPIVSDADAQAFLNAAVITSVTQASAVNTLVTSLKSAGIWTKMKAIYPFVGGSATSHKFNLKDPRDLDAAFRLVFSGGWTHTSTGAKPNGTNAYANTYLNSFLVFGNGQSHLPAGSTHSLVHVSKYSRTNSIPSIGFDGVYSDGGSSAKYMFLGWSSTYGSPNGYASLNGWELTGPRSGVTLGNRTDGFFVINRGGFTSLKSFRNNTLISTNTNDVRSFNETGLQLNLNPNGVFLIGSRNDAYDGVFRPFAYNDFETSFESIGNGLTDTEAANFYTAVQAFQTELGRQV